MTLSTPSLDSWRQELRDSFTTVADLHREGLISDSEAVKLKHIGDRFKVRVTPYYAKLIEPSMNCPIRRQTLPSLSEEDPALPSWATLASQEIYGRPTPWHSDPIGDLENLAAPRLTHRYKHRALLHLSSLCAVYCRFCFRKSHLNDEERTLYKDSLEPSFAYLEKTETIREVILTGGDPLSITDTALASLLERLSVIRHIRTVRIHTRMTVTLPSRVTPSLLDLLGRDWGFQIYISSHFNHPRELTPEASTALNGLRRAGITLLNQSVLLKGVNDSVECLHVLFQSLYEKGVIPFYLHHPDWTPGTFYFRPSIEEGRQLVSQLRGLLPGPALPDYVLDIPQGFGKISLMDGSVRKIQDLGSNLSLTEVLRGAVYEVIPPTTLRDPLKSDARHRYLDLFQVQTH